MAQNRAWFIAHRSLNPTSAGPGTYLIDGDFPLAGKKIAWDDAARRAHIERHGIRSINFSSSFAQSPISVTRPGFRDRVNGDVYRFDFANRVIAVITQDGKIKTGFVPDRGAGDASAADMFFRLATINYFNRTGKSLAQLSELRSEAAAFGTAREDVLRDIDGFGSNSPLTSFLPLRVRA